MFRHDSRPLTQLVLCRALDSAQVRKQQDESIFSKLTNMASSLGAPRAASPNCKAMVPMLDLMNHRTDARARFSYDARVDVFSVAAERAYAKGEQVRACTGSHLTLLGLFQHDITSFFSTRRRRRVAAARAYGKDEQVRVCMSWYV